MTQFNLEQFRAGAIALDREGREWRYVRDCSKDGAWTFTARYDSEDLTSSFVANGGYNHNGDECTFDLIAMKPEVVTGMSFEFTESIRVDPTENAPMQSALTVQEGGSHYKDLKIQPVEYIHANGIPYIEGSVIKYVTRWKNKGGIGDLEKARHFLDILIELEVSEKQEEQK